MTNYGSYSNRNPVAGITAGVLTGFAFISFQAMAHAEDIAKPAQKNSVRQLSGEVSKIKAAEKTGTASKESIDSADQRLIDAERALVQSLSARALANNGGNQTPAADKKAEVAQKEKPTAPQPGSKVAVKAVGNATTFTVETTEATKKENASQKAEVVSVAMKAAPAAPSGTVAAQQPPREPHKQAEKEKAPVTNDGGEGAEATAKRAVTAPKRPSTTTELQSIKNANESLRQELDDALERIESLQRELDQSQGQLTMAETEVSRLSARLDSRNRASLNKYNMPVPAPANPAPRNVARTDEPARRFPGETALPASNAELPVATIIVDKADLRLGPGRNHSALMSLRRGSRLVVERREGEWYRVFTPNGDRAWISAELVVFGDGAATLNDGSSIRVKGFNAGVEDEAFRRMQKDAAGR